jgi:DNA polymerase-3 subunit gamma/tau
VLHRLQLIQLIPGYRPEEGSDDDHALDALAQRMTPEDVQLYYQIATSGRRDLAIAPDARTGFEMAMLRMLAFRPDVGTPVVSSARPLTTQVTPAATPAAPQQQQRPQAAPTRSVPAAPTRPPATTQPSAPPSAASMQSPAVAQAAPTPALAAIPLDANGLPHWESLIERAHLRGPFGLLAQNALLRERDGNTLVLALQPAHMNLAVEPMVSQMEERIGQALGERIRLRFVSNAAHATSETPAVRAAQARDTAQSAAEESIEEDPLVQSMKREFGARIVPQSIKPFSQAT